MLVRGIKRSTGEYNGRPYDNIMIHCTAPNDGSMLAGEPVEILKIKTALFYEELGRLGCGDPAELVGLNIRERYNKFGNVVGIDI